MTPLDRLHAGLSAADEGRYEEALREYIWFHEQALELEPALYGVRRSFALAYWAELGKRYPAARDALIHTRDRKVASLRLGLRFRDSFRDVAAINHYLADLRCTAAMFAMLAKLDDAFARQCAVTALPALIDSGMFALACRFFPEPSKALDEHCARFNEDVDAAECEGRSSERYLEACVCNYVESVRLLGAMLRGAGDPDAANQLETAAVIGVRIPAVRESVRAVLLAST